MIESGENRHENSLLSPFLCLLIAFIDEEIVYVFHVKNDTIMSSM